MAGGEGVATVFLIRHAAHERQDRILVGRMAGVGLGERGREQAAALAARFASMPVAAVYSSPLERARRTAEPIAAACGRPVNLADAITEIEFGEWTGRPLEALAGDERWERWNGSRAEGCAPGGERMAAVQNRAMGALEFWRHQHAGGAVAAVSHGDVIKSAVCGVLGLSLDRYHAFDIDPASVTTIALWAGGGKVLAMNERPA